MLEIEINGKKVKLSDELIAEFEALPDTPFWEWSEETDAILLTFWVKKNKGELAKKLGIPRNTLQNRYDKLMGEVG